jgi:hypothetical protein
MIRFSVSLLVLFSMLAILLTGGCASTAKNFRVSSSAFDYGSRLPSKYTQDGAGTSPPLAWANVPSGTQSFALILDDPDAPLPGGFTHWVLYNIPATVTSLLEAIPAGQSNMTGGGLQGVNGTGKPGYIGPAPPSGSGIHLYRFNLYALNVVLNLSPGATKDDLLAAMGTHMIGNALLTGTYSKP